MEEVQVGVIYTTLLDSNEGDRSPHESQIMYFSSINENKISDRETPVELSSLEPQYGTEPLLIISHIAYHCKSHRIFTNEPICPEGIGVNIGEYRGHMGSQYNVSAWGSSCFLDILRCC